MFAREEIKLMQLEMASPVVFIFKVNWTCLFYTDF